ncbi:hypothetical protein ACFRAM_00250 [Paenibacillus sp. NPDC056722]|uniref:hypothetical protein n=1 Tax=Paenibacillus sp. NPDC056722 TaxID=3345924 RepID=UPI0036873547
MAKHDAESKEWVLTEWARLELLLYDLIVAGQQSGELSKTLNAEWLSQYFNKALVGIRVMVKSITDRDKFRLMLRKGAHTGSKAAYFYYNFGTFVQKSESSRLLMDKNLILLPI